MAKLNKIKLYIRHEHEERFRYLCTVKPAATLHAAVLRYRAAHPDLTNVAIRAKYGEPMYKPGYREPLWKLRTPMKRGKRRVL